MYRETFACIKQSAHEQLFERDCRCMRVAEKSVYTFSKTYLIFFSAENKRLTKTYSLNANDLETSKVPYLTLFCIESKEHFSCLQS